MRSNSLKLRVECLETRATPASGISLQTGGVLTIEGTIADNKIFVIPDAANATRIVATLQTGTSLTSQSFAKTSVTSIKVLGLAGNDTIVNNTSFNTWADGGAGNDSVWGGSGNDTIYGGDGYDQLHARGHRATSTVG